MSNPYYIGSLQIGSGIVSTSPIGTVIANADITINNTTVAATVGFGNRFGNTNTNITSYYSQAFDGTFTNNTSYGLTPAIAGLLIANTISSTNDTADISIAAGVYSTQVFSLTNTGTIYNMAAAIFKPTLSISHSSIVVQPNFYGQYIKMGAVTLTNAAHTLSMYAGVFIDTPSASSLGTGQITSAFAGYFKTPSVGTNSAGIYADSLSIGNAAPGIMGTGDMYVSGTIKNTALGDNTLVATDGSKNLTTSVTGLSPTFTGLTLSGLSSTLIWADASHVLSSVTLSANFAGSFAGILDTVQDIQTSSNPQFNALGVGVAAAATAGTIYANNSLGVGVAPPTTSGYAQINTMLGVAVAPLYPLDVTGSTRLLGVVGIGTSPSQYIGVSNTFNIIHGGGVRLYGEYIYTGIQVNGSTSTSETSALRIGGSLVNYGGATIGSSTSIYITSSITNSSGSSISIPAGIRINPSFSGDSPMTSVYGIYIDAIAGNNLPTTAYGIYAKAPTVGTANVAIYADNMAIGTDATLPPTNGLLVLGNIKNTALADSTLVATDGSKNLTTSVTGLSPTFTGLTLSGLSSTLVWANGSNVLSAVTLSANFAGSFAGTLDTVQGIQTSSSPQFSALGIGVAATGTAGTIYANNSLGVGVTPPTTVGYAQINARLGLASAPSATSGFINNISFTGAAASYYAEQITSSFTYSSGSITQSGVIFIDGTAANITTVGGTISALAASIINNANIVNTSGSLAAAHGYYSKPVITGTTTIGTSASLYLDTPAITGTVTNAYGIYNSVPTGGATNYGYYQAGSMVTPNDVGMQLNNYFISTSPAGTLCQFKCSPTFNTNLSSISYPSALYVAPIFTVTNNAITIAYGINVIMTDTISGAPSMDSSIGISIQTLATGTNATSIGNAYNLYLNGMTTSLSATITNGYGIYNSVPTGAAINRGYYSIGTFTKTSDIGMYLNNTFTPTSNDGTLYQLNITPTFNTITNTILNAYAASITPTFAIIGQGITYACGLNIVVTDTINNAGGFEFSYGIRVGTVANGANVTPIDYAYNLYLNGMTVSESAIITAGYGIYNNVPTGANTNTGYYQAGIFTKTSDIGMRLSNTFTPVAAASNLYNLYSNPTFNTSTGSVTISNTYVSSIAPTFNVTSNTTMPGTFTNIYCSSIQPTISIPDGQTTVTTIGTVYGQYIGAISIALGGSLNHRITNWYGVYVATNPTLTGTTIGKFGTVYGGYFAAPLTTTADAVTGSVALWADSLNIGGSVSTASTSGYAKINARLGIAMDPTYPLDITGNARFSTYVAVGNATPGTYMLDVTGNTRITTALGVGTTPPAGAGDVNINSSLGVGVAASGTAGTIYANNSLGVGVTPPTTAGYAKINARLGIAMDPTYPLDITGNARFSTYVAVGNATPGTYMLDVTGNTRITTALGVGTTPPAGAGDVNINSSLGVGVAASGTAGTIYANNSLGVGVTPPATAGYAQINARLGLSSAPSTTSGFLNAISFTGAAAAYYAEQITSSFTYSSGSTAQSGVLFIDGTAANITTTGGTITIVASGIINNANIVNTSGSLANIYGYYSRPSITATTAITQFASVYLDTPTIITGTNIPNAYGIYNNIPTAAVTNTGYYQAGTFIKTTDRGMILNDTFSPTTTTSSLTELSLTTTYNPTSGPYTVTNFYNQFINPTITKTSASIITTTAYTGLRIAPSAISLSGSAHVISDFYNIYSSIPAPTLANSATITRAYSGYFVNPSAGTSSVALYADNAQIGGTLLSGSTKTSFLYVDGRLGIGGSQNDVNKVLYLNKQYTSTATTTYGSMFNNTITAPTGATTNIIYGVHMADTLYTNTSNTGATTAGLSVQNTSDGTTTAITTSHGVYCAPVITGTVATAYSGYFVAPSGTATNKVAVYADSIKVGAAVSGNQTTGTVVATSTGTFSNINLSDFTFVDSLACAAQTYTGAGVVYWQGMNSNVNTTIYFTRFGHLVMLRMPTWNYPNTSTTQTPVIAYNPAGWAPPSNILLPVIANHGNAYVHCTLLVNTNCTIYLYSPQYSTPISATNGGQAFPADCCVSWSKY